MAGRWGRTVVAAMLSGALLAPADAGAQFGSAAEPSFGEPSDHTHLVESSYEYVTTVPSPAGDVVRRHLAVIGVPQPLDVDRDVAPDLVGTLVPAGHDSVRLRIERAFGETAALPLRIEAILAPWGGTLPREHLNFGYDAREGRAPSSWRGAIEADADGGPAKLRTEQQVVGAGSTLKTLAGLFDGDALQRVAPIGGALRQAPVSPASGLELTLGGTIVARAGSSAPTTAQVVAELVQGPSARRLTTAVAPLPREVVLRYREAAGHSRAFEYSATAPVGSVEATYTGSVGGELKSKALLRGAGLPVGLAARQVGAARGEFSATGGPAARVEAGFADGEPLLLDADHPYARVHDQDAVRSVAARIDALRSAVVDASGPVAAELVLGPDARKPFRMLAESPGRRAEWSAEGLPRHLSASFAPDAGLIEHDGFGESPGALTFSAEQATPFFDRVRHVRATLNPTEPADEVRLTATAGELKLAAGHGPNAEVLLTSGPVASLPPGQLGVQVEDLAARYTAFARVAGLRSVTVSPSGADVGAGVDVADEQRFRMRHLTDGRTVDAFVPVAGATHLSVAPGAGTLGWRGEPSGAPLEVSISSEDALFGRVKRLDAQLTGLPPALSAGFRPAGGSGVHYTTTAPVETVEARLTDGAAPVAPPRGSRMTLTDVPSAFAASMRLSDATSARLTAAGADVDAAVTAASGEDVELDATYGSGGTPADLAARVTDPPGTFTLAQRGAATSYTGSAPTGTVAIDAHGLSGSGALDDGEVHGLAATLQTIPAGFQITSGPAIGVTAAQALGRVDLEAWDRGGRRVAPPEDGRNHLRLDTRDGRLHLQARVADVQRAQVSREPGGATAETWFEEAPAPLAIGIDGGTGAEPLDLDAVVTDVPQASRLRITGDHGTAIEWDAGVPGADLALDLAARDAGARVSLPDLPSFTEVCIGSGLSDCSPASQSVFDSGGEQWLLPNMLTAVASGNGTVTVDGTVCLPPTDDDGGALQPPGTVFGTCLDGTAPNRVEMTRLRMAKQRLELAAGDTTNEDEDGDPVEDDLLKLHVSGDDTGVKADGLRVRNETSDTTVVLKAGHTGGPPLRTPGAAFFWLADLSGIPDTQLQSNQIECGDLLLEVDLPHLGAMDVLPGFGDFFFEDLCVE